MKITKLKGGSLNVTSLHYEHAYSDKNFVRKSVSLTENREYGFVRWLSQLKKMQHLRSRFPDYIPEIKSVRVEGDMAYFDMEYLENYRDMKVILCDIANPPSDRDVEDMHACLWKAFDRFFSVAWQATTDKAGNAALYFREEVFQKIQDGLKHPQFREFYDLGEYEFHGRKVKGVDMDLLHKFETELTELISSNKIPEVLTLGNPTLENIMYLDSRQRVSYQSAIKFIDLYGESMIDIPHMEYSQILQCSNSFYGFINDRDVTVSDDGVVTHGLIIPPALQYFNDLFNDELKSRLSYEEYRLVKLLELTHFFRMIPFKSLTGEYTKAKYFYVHACSLLRALYE